MFEQPFIELIFIGLAFKLAGFLVRDELILRSLVLTGMACDVVFYYLQSPAIWASVIANTSLVIVNLALITIIIFERSTWFMSAKERMAFEHFKTLSPGQFRRIMRGAHWRVAMQDTILLREGERSDKLYFLETDHFYIRKKGTEYTASGPAFAGEIMFLQGGVASATVAVPQGATYVEWDASALHWAMKKSRPLDNALVARFGQDLADKVRNSVPLPQDAIELDMHDEGPPQDTR